AGFGGFDASVGDLLRCDRERRMLGIERRAAGDGAGEDGLPRAHDYSSHSMLPLSAINSPVIFLPCAEVRYSTRSANSPGSTLVRSDRECRSAFSMSAKLRPVASALRWTMKRKRSLLMMPGRMALQRMPKGPSSRAQLRVSPSTPAFEAMYGARNGMPVRVEQVEKLTIEPPPLAFNMGIARFMQ